MNDMEDFDAVAGDTVEDKVVLMTPLPDSLPNLGSERK